MSSAGGSDRESQSMATDRPADRRQKNRLFAGCLVLATLGVVISSAYYLFSLVRQDRGSSANPVRGSEIRPPDDAKRVIAVAKNHRYLIPFSDGDIPSADEIAGNDTLSIDVYVANFDGDRVTETCDILGKLESYGGLELRVYGDSLGRKCDVSSNDVPQQNAILARLLLAAKWTHVSIRSVPIDAESAGALVRSGARSADLYDCQCSESTLTQLDPLNHFELLQLSQQECDATWFARCPRGNRLRGLYLNCSSPMTLEGSRAIGAIDSLETLQLGCGRLNPQSIDELCKAKALRTLYLAAEGIDTAALKALGRAKGLRSLDLSQSDLEIGEEECELLCAFKHLDSLQLAYVPISPEHFKKILRALKPGVAKFAPDMDNDSY